MAGKPSTRSEESPNPFAARGLTRGVIVTTARSLLERDPGAEFSMRGLAQQLGVATPSLYKYFRSRTDLLEAVALEVFAGIELPTLTGRWRSDATALLRALRDVTLHNPQLTAAFATWHVPRAFTRIDGGRLLQILLDAGLPPEDAGFAGRQLTWHVFGYLYVERNLPWRRAQPGIEASVYVIDVEPTDDAAARQVDVDALFDRSLTYLLDGIEAQLQR